LALATSAGQVLRHQPDVGLNPAVVRTFNSRIRAWWLMCTVLAASFLMGPGVTVFLFGLISFWALREFITLTPTRLGDHRTLFWVFFLFTPLQYVLVAYDKYEMYSILIPVYGSLFILARVALAGDYKRFLERTAKIQAGMIICVYCLSHAPALLYLDLKRVSPGDDKANARLLFFFILMVQLNDVLQYGWSKMFGRRVIASMISPSKTWEGFFGGAGSTALLGMALYWATPFEPWEAAILSLVIAMMGFAGGMTMSAIKRDRGVKDYGTLVVGHGGVLDRIDSVCFAAPVFYHLTRYYFSN
jgi:phosphatidate cytidylyltransferase